MAARQLFPISMSFSQPYSGANDISKPGPSPTATTSNYSKRSNVTSACEACRQKKSRCDGQQPCAMCLSARRECKFPRKDRRRQHERGEPLRALQAELENLQAALEVLRFGSEDEALRALKELRTETPDDSSQANSDAAQQDVNNPIVQATESESGHKSSMPVWDNDQSPGQIPRNIPLLFDVSQLPPKAGVDRAAGFFFDIVAGFLYVIEEKDFVDLRHKVYNPEIDHTVFDLTEVCAVAAVGMQYDPNTVTSPLRDALFRTVVQNTNDMVEYDSIRALRCIACLCIYSLVSKRSSIRALIHQGLQIARWSSDRYAETDHNHFLWSNLFRTIICLECWLSATLGYQPDIASDEADLIFNHATLHQNTTDEMSQAKIAELGLLRVRVLQLVCSAPPPSATIVAQLMTEMETWYQSLPGPVTLAVLFSGVSSSGGSIQQGAPILAHAKYLGTIILLHRRILAAMAYTRLGRDWDLPEVTLEQAQKSHEQGVDAARSSARIFVILNSATNNSKMHTTCWLFLFEIFTVCTVLLYDIAIRLSMAMQHDTHLGEDLQRTGACLIILTGSSNTDLWLQRRLPVLTSIHQTLKVLYSRTMYGSLHSPSTLTPDLRHDEATQNPKTSGNNQKNPGEPSLNTVPTQAIHELAAILNDPFGQGEEVGFNLLSHGSDHVKSEYKTNG